MKRLRALLALVLTLLLALPAQAAWLPGLSAISGHLENGGAYRLNLGADLRAWPDLDERSLAALGGWMFAVLNSQVTPGSFTIALSITLLVAAVLGGAASIVGPALGAILIVAFFYTEQVFVDYLLIASGVTAVLLALNRLKIASIGVYILVGVVLWVVMYQSGISPTIAGVIVAACVPLRAKDGHSPLHEAEHTFRPWVLFGIMPVFAFANAGISLDGASQYLTHPITLGAAFGLAAGKPVGIAVMTYLGAKLMKASKPGNVAQIIGVGCIAGVGFTMSLFVGALAFSDPALATPVRLGVYAGSIFSALLGLVILAYSLPKRARAKSSDAEDQIRPFILAEPEYEAYEKARP